MQMPSYKSYYGFHLIGNDQTRIIVLEEVLAWKFTMGKSAKRSDHV